MNNFFHLPLSVMISFVQLKECKSTDVKRFIIVSGYETALRFYYGTHRSSKDSCEWNIELSVKKRICEDIIGSDLFNHQERTERLVAEAKPTFTFMSSLFRDSRTLSNYSRTTITVHGYGSDKSPEENVFVCLSRIANSSEIIKTYISDEYNLNSETSRGSSHYHQYLPGRFIFRKNSRTKRIHLYGIAGTPAIAFVSSDYSIEHLYVQRRRTYRVAWKNVLDALCKLARRIKRLICMAVFNSEYFDGRVQYPRDVDENEYEYECELKTVSSFQTKLGRRAAAQKKRKFRERMLKCNDDDEGFHYYISQAYRSHETFVYFHNPYTQEISVENLSTNIYLPVGDNRLYFVGDEENVLEDSRVENTSLDIPNCILC